MVQVGPNMFIQTQNAALPLGFFPSIIVRNFVNSVISHSLLDDVLEEYQSHSGMRRTAIQLMYIFANKTHECTLSCFKVQLVVLEEYLVVEHFSP